MLFISRIRHLPVVILTMLSAKHGPINYVDTKAKWDFAAGVYQSLQTGDAVSHVGIFGPAL